MRTETQTVLPAEQLERNSNEDGLSDVLCNINDRAPLRDHLNFSDIVLACVFIVPEIMHPVRGVQSGGKRQRAAVTGKTRCRMDSYAKRNLVGGLVEHNICVNIGKLLPQPDLRGLNIKVELMNPLGKPSNLNLHT